MPTKPTPGAQVKSPVAAFSCEPIGSGASVSPTRRYPPYVWPVMLAQLQLEAIDFFAADHGTARGADVEPPPRPVQVPAPSTEERLRDRRRSAAAPARTAVAGNRSDPPAPRLRAVPDRCRWRR